MVENASTSDQGASSEMLSRNRASAAETAMPPNSPRLFGGHRSGDDRMPPISRTLKTCLRRARQPGYHPPRHAARPPDGDAHDADLTTPDPLPRRRRRAPACRPWRGFRAGSRRSGAQDHPFSDTQGAVPQSFQAAQLIAQAWRQLGLDVEVRPTARQQLSQVVWYERERWDATMWRMVGRPERSDPDELVFNLFHSSTAPRG